MPTVIHHVKPGAGTVWAAVPTSARNHHRGMSQLCCSLSIPFGSPFVGWLKQQSCEFQSTTEGNQNALPDGTLYKSNWKALGGICKNHATHADMTKLKKSPHAAFISTALEADYFSRMVPARLQRLGPSPELTLPVSVLDLLGRRLHDLPIDLASGDPRAYSLSPLPLESGMLL